MRKNSPLDITGNFIGNNGNKYFLKDYNYKKDAKHSKNINNTDDTVACTESCLKVSSRFYCKNCNYYTNKKSSFDKHLTTTKHTKLTKENNFSNKVANDIKSFLCVNCNNHFKSRVGLWKHNKKCIQPRNQEKDEPTDKQLIMLLIKENSELRKQQTEIKEMILEIVKNGITNNK